MTFFHPRWPVFIEDNHLLVLYKPAGLIIQRDNKNKANLVDLAKIWLKKRYDKPGNVYLGMVHRLDAPVAGVVVMARTSKAAGRLSRQFRESAVSKTYLAVVEGRPPREVDRLIHHLVRRGRYSRPAVAGTAGSQTASLSYRLLESRDRTSLLSIDLETGRRHQIRAQLAALNCPILGDRAYGSSHSMTDGRIALIANKLSFSHPTRIGPVDVECPVPRGWPWIKGKPRPDAPLWSIEDFQSQGLNLADL